LRARREEIEQTILARVYGVSDSQGQDDPEYVSGLRAAVSAAIDYGIAGLSSEHFQPLPVPPQVLVQARYAARNRVGLDTVLRRYIAGYTLISDFIVQEAADAGAALKRADLQRVWRAEAALFDRVVVAVTAEYAHEEKGRLRSSEQRRAERVRALLAGEMLGAGELGYEFDAWHVGVIAAGREAREAVRELGAELDRRVLLVQVELETVWAWLGGQGRVAVREVANLTEEGRPAGITIVVGEPAWGIAGWRLTHRQAKAAMPVARRRRQSITHYADVSLLASMLQDEVLSSSLRDLYLTPLADQRDGGLALRETLRTYFTVERNVSSTAAALKIDRKTVNSRLRLVEDRIGRPLGACAAELEAALCLDELENN
jgi:hypothetical protein